VLDEQAVIQAACNSHALASTPALWCSNRQGSRGCGHYNRVESSHSRSNVKVKMIKIPARF